MQNRYSIWLIPIAILFGVSAWLAWPTNTLLSLGDLGAGPLTRDISVRQGLDLQGGLQILLEADTPPDKLPDQAAMEATIRIIESRINGLGVSEPVIQQSGLTRVVVELPGLKNIEQALALIKQTGVLEFVDAGSEFLAEGTLVKTDYVAGSKSLTGPTATPVTTATATAVATAASTPAATAAAAATPTASPTALPNQPTYHTIMTGAALQTVSVQTDPRAGGVVIAFTLTDEGKKIFAEHTANNVGRVLAIVLDKRVISAPRINSAIPDGQGIIQGSFNSESANNLALQLRYGSLPVPLKIAETRLIGPSLGQDSVRKSLIAGLIGLSMVALFMILYYRLPGALAVVSFLLYATVTFALFKLIPVTLTLPGIAGFLLSIGAAVDANILIFERMKEELRAGRNVRQAVSDGFRRALPSIIDSNVATLITSGILFWFGSQFGATIVKGFAFTLALGVGVSLLTAALVTRTMLNALSENFDFSDKLWWFGVEQKQ